MAFKRIFLCSIIWCVPVFASVSIVSFTPSSKSPQPIGKTITWTATATDTGAGPLTFQFNVQPPGGTMTLVKDFNVGKLSGGTWTSVPFVWVPTGAEGVYKVQLVIKDFGTNSTQSRILSYAIVPIAGSAGKVVRMANPLVALFSAPSCAVGSTMRVVFQVQSGSSPASGTNWVSCHPPTTMTFEVAGLLPSTAYNMTAETNTGGTMTSGTTLSFTTGALPKTIPFPKFNVKTSASSSDPNPVIVHGLINLGGGTNFPAVATDLSGNLIWYYYPNDVNHGEVVLRVLPGGDMLVLEDDYAWNPNVSQEQFLRQIDLAGNIVRETNIGILQQKLLAMGSPAGGPCPTNPTIGSACIGAFHHDAIQTLPNGYTAVLVDEEKIFPSGTQGDNGNQVDIIGDMILVLDTNWQLVWYWDVFNPDGVGNVTPGYGYAKLPVSRKAVPGGAICGASSPGCPPMLLLTSPGQVAQDWLHANSLYYWPAPQNGNATGGDIIWSSRHQDWVFRIDYRDRAGTGNILWRMGPFGDFTNTNPFNDPWVWFSGQHDAGIENNGSGVMTLFDNGNTRTAPPPKGLGTNCKPYDCNSRGMALTFDESAMTVTPVLSVDLGKYSTAMGSAQMLSNGTCEVVTPPTCKYFFENPIVVVSISATAGYSLEIGPIPAAPQGGPANTVLNLAGPEHYRAFQMPSLYYPPTT